MNGLSVGEVAERAGVTVGTVRYYEQVGVIGQAPRTFSGHRRFAPGVVRRIILIRQLASVGFSLGEIREMFELGASREASRREVRRRGGAATVITALTCFVLMQAAIMTASATVLPGVLPRIGRAPVIGANAVTAIAVALFLRWTWTPKEVTTEIIPQDRENELMESPGLV